MMPPADNDWKHSFPPASGQAPLVLLLGSMPGEESLRQRQYYAYRYNAFWRIAGEIFHFSPETTPYPERIRILNENRIALWDVLSCCTREGSLDTRIRNPRPNDIPSFLLGHPTIQRIFCNGGAAYQLLKRFFPDLFRKEKNFLCIERLPSTSPAAASIRYEEKLRLYRTAFTAALRNCRGGKTAGKTPHGESFLQQSLHHEVAERPCGEREKTQ